MIVIDDFIKDQDLLNRLKEDNTFWDDKGYYWWNGWWNARHDVIIF